MMKRSGAIAVLLISVAMGAGAPAGATAPAPSSTVPAMVLPGCEVDLGGPTEGAASGCLAGVLRAAADTASARDARDETVPCVEVPLLDDRCESWSTVFDGGEGDVSGDGIGASKMVATDAIGSAVYTLGVTDTAAGAATDFHLLVTAADGASGDQRWSDTMPPVHGFSRMEAVTVLANPAHNTVIAIGRAFDETGCARQTLIIANDAATGERLWTSGKDVPSGECGTVRAAELSPDGATLYLVGGQGPVTGGSVMHLSAFDARTGLHRWSDGFTSESSGGAAGSAVAVSPDGSTVYAAGSGMVVNGTSRRTTTWPLVAYDASGTRKWVAEWKAPHPEAAAPANPPAAVAVSPDGTRAFVVGGAEGQTLFDIFTVGFDTADGRQLWESGYEGIRRQVKSSFDSVWYHGPLAVSPDGRTVYVAGYSSSLHGANLSMDFVTLALGAEDGTTVWQQRHTGDEWIHWFPAVAVHPDGGEVYVAGQARHFQLISAAFETFAYDAATGEQNWTARYSDGLSYWNGMAMSRDGQRLFSAGAHVPIGGNPNRNDAYDLLTVGYDIDS